MPSAYGPYILFMVLKSAQILIHNTFNNIECLWPILGLYSAFQVYQILYTTLWEHLTNPECIMIPPVAEFGFSMNKLFFVQVINVYRKQFRSGVGSQESGRLNLGPI